jgi:hypothetical protein
MQTRCWFQCFTDPKPNRNRTKGKNIPAGRRKKRLKTELGRRRRLKKTEFLTGGPAGLLKRRCHFLEEYRGIRICALNWSDQDDDRFLRRTKQALDLIAATDPRRYQYVTHHIRYILNTELYTTATYCPGGVCKIDFGRYQFNRNPTGYLYRYSSALIHEATHGRLLAKGFRRGHRNWVQIERICRAEQNRFLAACEPVYGAPLQIPFDPKAWDFGSRWHRLKCTLSRIREEKMKAQKSAAFRAAPPHR